MLISIKALCFWFHSTVIKAGNSLLSLSVRCVLLFVAHFLCMPGCSCLCLITYQTLLGSLLLCCKNFFLFILQQRRETVCKTLELKPDETSYTDIMHRLVKRYLFKLERAKDEKENGKLHTLQRVRWWCHTIPTWPTLHSLTHISP